MKKAWLPFLLLITNTLIFSACKKNSVTEQYTETVNPVIPDFTTQVNASVNGFITDENGAAVQGATVKGGAVTVTSNQYGYFKINTAAFAKSAGFVQVTKAGYFTGYRTFLPIEGKETFIRLQLIPNAITGNMDAATGGTVTTTDGAKVTLPANAVVNAVTNAAYTGTVSIAVHWLNPTEENKTQLTMPGNLLGVDSLGYLKALVTYGMLAVELTGSAGELLQIGANKKALLNFPIPGAMSATAPAIIPLWYFDETKGLWKQDGLAVKNGNNYAGEVSHFSFWNCDVPTGVVNFSIQIIDTALQPLSNVPLSISIAGQPNSQRINYSDANGFIAGMVPANSSLVLEIVVPCNDKISFKNINTTNTGVDLGSVVVNLQQYAAVVKGTVNKCNGSVVTNGYVIIAGFGTNAIINIQNGSFTSSGTICPGTNAAIIAFDNDAAQASSPQNVLLTTGQNILTNPISACNTVTTESISVIKDGNVATNFLLPQFMFGGNFYFANDSSELNATDLLNGNQIVFQVNFRGSAVEGIYSLSGNRFKFGANTFQFVSPTSVNISSYGLVGQFISGSFSGTAADILTPGDTHTFSCSFNIKRDM